VGRRSYFGPTQSFHWIEERCAKVIENFIQIIVILAGSSHRHYALLREEFKESMQARSKIRFIRPSASGNIIAGSVPSSGNQGYPVILRLGGKARLVADI
jgi:hypothetical protein